MLNFTKFSHFIHTLTKKSTTYLERTELNRRTKPYFKGMRENRRNRKKTVVKLLCNTKRKRLWGLIIEKRENFIIDTHTQTQRLLNAEI